MRQMHSDDRLGICPDPDPATADRTDHVHYRRNRGQNFRLTGNIYIAAIVNTLLIVMITVANTSFSFPY